MPRTAISFSGMPRVVPSAVNCWKCFISKHEADVYVHTWNTDHEAVAVLQESFAPVSMLVESPRSFGLLGDYDERAQASNPYNVFSMWTSIRESMLLIQRRKERYDRVVRARFDLLFDDFDFLDVHGVVIPGKPAEIYCWKDHRYPGWHDLMAYGDQDSMDLYSQTLDQIPVIYGEGSPFFSEFFLSTHLYRTKTNTTHHGIFADISRK